MDRKNTMSTTRVETDKPLPKHIAIIMDGNGRWAQARGKNRSYGHKAGAEIVRPIVTECSDLGLEALTLYAFSTENWTRSREEIDTLMDLYVAYLESERQLFFDNNVRFNQIGRREGLPNQVLDTLDRMQEDTAKHDGLTMTLALNYGSRSEITDAMRAIATKVAKGVLPPGDIDEQTIAEHLYTHDLPDPDLLIRTAGEMRLSNYLLWQLSYAEFYVTDVCWPEFSVDELHKALAAFKGRTRRFGGVVEEPA